MKSQDLLSILITFVVGIFAGGYLYLTSFASLVDKFDEIPTVEIVSEFSVVGEAYGGCRSSCSSFQVVNNGSYRYLYSPPLGSDQVVRQGDLPAQLQRNLKKVITTEAVKNQSLPIRPASCRSFVDGIDIKYEITIDGSKYVIDSCGTSVDTRSSLWVTLDSVWDYFETAGGT